MESAKPRNPLGATMVSSEGACAAYYLYRRLDPAPQRTDAAAGSAPAGSAPASPAPSGTAPAPVPAAPASTDPTTLERSPVA